MWKKNKEVFGVFAIKIIRLWRKKNAKPPVMAPIRYRPPATLATTSGDLSAVRVVI